MSAPPTSTAASVSQAPPTACKSATRSASSPAIATRPSTSTTGTSPSAPTASNNSGRSPRGGRYIDQTAAIPLASDLVLRYSQTIHRSTPDQCYDQKLRHTGEGRCPSRKWVPAFPTEQVRGLKAHGKEEEDAALNHLNASEY